MFGKRSAPPQTGLEPPAMPVVTLFSVLEESLGRGRWLYYQLLQVFMAGMRFGQSANEEMLRQLQFRLEHLRGGMTDPTEEPLRALGDYVGAALQLWRSQLRAGEAVREQNEDDLAAAVARAKEAAGEGIAHLDRARLALEPVVAGLGAGDPRRALPAYVAVLQLELEDQLQVVDHMSASVTSKEVGRYLETATRAAATHREIGRRIAALRIPDPGVDEMAQNMDRLADMVEEHMAAVRRMSDADLKYMPLLGDRVFLIHGHAPDYQAVKEILTRLGFGDRITVLKEEPNRGQTVLDKFVTHAGRACMAVALVTPDDVVSDGSATHVQARPNVLFEVGWFLGRFGPEKVCLLVRRGTPLPSDLGGVLTLEYDDDVTVVEPELRREIEAMGLLGPAPVPTPGGPGP
jgi:predicted nucleotide-binding protein